MLRYKFCKRYSAKTCVPSNMPFCETPSQFAKELCFDTAIWCRFVHNVLANVKLKLKIKTYDNLANRLQLLEKSLWYIQTVNACVREGLYCLDWASISFLQNTSHVHLVVHINTTCLNYTRHNLHDTIEFIYTKIYVYLV